MILPYNVADVAGDQKKSTYDVDKAFTILLKHVVQCHYSFLQLTVSANPVLSSNSHIAD